MNRVFTQIWPGSAIMAVCLLVTVGLLPTDVAKAQGNSAAFCDSHARDVSRHVSRGGGIGGAVRGAAGGAAIGAIVNGRRGARRGAAIGAITAGTARAVQRSRIYNQAYSDCLRGLIRPY